VYANRCLTEEERKLYDVETIWLNDEPTIKHYTDFPVNEYSKYAPKPDIPILFFYTGQLASLVNAINYDIYRLKSKIPFEIIQENYKDNNKIVSMCTMWLTIYKFEDTYLNLFFDIFNIPRNKIVRRCGLLVMPNFSYSIRPDLNASIDTIKKSDEYFKNMGFLAVYVVCTHRRSVNAFLDAGYSVFYGSIDNVNFYRHEYNMSSDGLNETQVGLVKIFNPDISILAINKRFLKNESPVRNK
jgi:hypothetical protein